MTSSAEWRRFPSLEVDRRNTAESSKLMSPRPEERNVRPDVGRPNVIRLSPPYSSALLVVFWEVYGWHIHEAGIIRQSSFGRLPDGWVIIAIIDTGCDRHSYLGLMLLEFGSPTPSHHLVPWWIVEGKVICADTHTYFPSFYVLCLPY